MLLKKKAPDISSSNSQTRWSHVTSCTVVLTHMNNKLSEESSERLEGKEEAVQKEVDAQEVFVPLTMTRHTHLATPQLKAPCIYSSQQIELNFTDQQGSIQEAICTMCYGSNGNSGERTVRIRLPGGKRFLPDHPGLITPQTVRICSPMSSGQSLAISSDYKS